RRGRDQRRHQPVRLATLHAPDQVDPGSNVAPLITAADLDGALLRAEQVQEVERLEQHVAEFGVRDAALDARLHRLLLQHDVDAEMLADVTQEIHEALLRQPLGVVQHDGARLGRVEVEQAGHLVALALQVLADLLLREQRPLAALSARIADQAGAAAHQHDGLVAGQLEVPQPQYTVRRSAARCVPISCVAWWTKPRHSSSAKRSDMARNRTGSLHRWQAPSSLTR